MYWWDERHNMAHQKFIELFCGRRRRLLLGWGLASRNKNRCRSAATLKQKRGQGLATSAYGNLVLRKQSPTVSSSQETRSITTPDERRHSRICRSSYWLRDMVWALLFVTSTHRFALLPKVKERPPVLKQTPTTRKKKKKKNLNYLTGTYTAL